MHILILLTLYLLLFGSWVALLMALISLLNAIATYGISVTNIILDEKLGYSGLLAFGLSASVVALTSISKFKPASKFAKLSKITFTVCTFFLLPTVMAIFLYLTYQ